MEQFRRPKRVRVLSIEEKDQEVEEQETQGFVDMNKTRQIIGISVIDVKNYDLDPDDKFDGSIAEQVVPRVFKPVKLYRDGLRLRKFVEQPPSEEESALRRKLMDLEDCTGEASIMRENRPQWHERLCEKCAEYWIKKEVYKNQTECPQPYLCGTCLYCRRYARFLAYVFDFDLFEDREFKEYKGSECYRCAKKFPRLYRIYWTDGKLKVGINFKEKQVFDLEFTPAHQNGIPKTYVLQREVRTARFRNMKRKCKIHHEHKYFFCPACRRS